MLTLGTFKRFKSACVGYYASCAYPSSLQRFRRRLRRRRPCWCSPLLLKPQLRSASCPLRLGRLATFGRIRFLRIVFGLSQLPKKLSEHVGDELHIGSLRRI